MSFEDQNVPIRSCYRDLDLRSTCSQQYGDLDESAIKCSCSRGLIAPNSFHIWITASTGLVSKRHSYTQSSVCPPPRRLFFLYIRTLRKKDSQTPVFPAHRVDVFLFSSTPRFVPADPEFPSLAYIYNSRKTPVRCGLQIIHRYW